MSGTETATQQMGHEAELAIPARSAESFDRTDYWKDLAELQAEAEAGDANKQCRLGERYAWGFGVKEDQVQALEWWSRAAAQGAVGAHVSLGAAYESGNGVDPSDAMAAVFYRVAANAGDAQAQWCLGDLYADGRGVPQDNQEGTKWYRLAAAQGWGPMGPKR